jgi:hypothetical protein
LEASWAKLARIYPQNKNKPKGLREWFKWKSACPAIMRPCAQFPVPEKEKRGKMGGGWHKREQS